MRNKQNIYIKRHVYVLSMIRMFLFFLFKIEFVEEKFYPLIYEHFIILMNE